MATEFTKAQIDDMRALAELLDSELLGPCSTGPGRAFFMNTVAVVSEIPDTLHGEAEKDLVDGKV